MQNGRSVGHLAVEVEDTSESVKLLKLLKELANPPMKLELKDKQEISVVEAATAKGGELKRWAKTAGKHSASVCSSLPHSASL